MSYNKSVFQRYFHGLLLSDILRRYVKSTAHYPPPNTPIKLKVCSKENKTGERGQGGYRRQWVQGRLGGWGTEETGCLGRWGFRGDKGVREKEGSGKTEEMGGSGEIGVRGATTIRC